MQRWLERKHGEDNFHMSQMITGHGSFGHFLHRINRRDTSACFYCQAEDDTLEHTLSGCPVWDNARDMLIDELGLAPGYQLTLSFVIDKILESESNWSAFRDFCDFVLRLKEEEERRRERLHSPPSSLDS